MDQEKILIVFATKYGQTAKIAERLGQEIGRSGFPAKVISINEIQQIDLKSFAGVIIGTPVYASQFNKKILRWIRSAKHQIAQKPNCFFTVSLNAADQRPEARIADQNLISKFINLSDWSPRLTASLKGALPYQKYNFLIRYMMKRISAEAGGPVDTSQNYEMTDWKEVDALASKFLKLMPRNQNLKTEQATL